MYSGIGGQTVDRAENGPHDQGSDNRYDLSPP